MTYRQDAKRVGDRYHSVIAEAADQRTYRAIYNILTVGAGYASAITPQDTGTLLQSQYAPQVTIEGTAAKGHIGYTAKYAGWVHDMPGTLKGKPRADFGMTSNRSEAGPQKPTAFGGGTKTGTYWAPNAEPQFLVKGFAKGAPEFPGILKEAYSV